MSASRPSSSPTDPSQRLRSALRQHRKRDRGVWHLVSLALHGLALAALVYLTPVRKIVQELVRQVKPEQTMSAAGLAKLAEAIEDRAAEQIAANTRELKRVFEKITDIQGDISREFAGFEAHQKQSAAQNALEEMEKAVDQMEAAARSIEQDAPVETTDRFQALAEQAQQRAGEKLKMIAFDVAPAIAKQRRAETHHQEAKAKHYELSDQKVRVRAQENVVAAEQAATDELVRQLQQMKETGEPEEQTERQAERIAEQQARVEERRAELTTLQDEQANLHKATREAQKAALTAQKEALDALRAAVEVRRPQLAAAGPAQPDAAMRQADAPQPPDGQPVIDVPRLYEEARATEDDIAESFKEVRAMDLAMVRDMRLEDARDDIDLVRPTRPDLDAELLNSAARTDRRFEAHKEEIKKALRETASMVNLAHRMLDMATQSVEKMKFGTDLAAAEPEALDRRDFQLIIRELAMEEVGGRFSDMAAMMQALEAEAEGAAARTVDFEDLTEELAEGPMPQFGMDGPEQGDMPQLTPDVPAVGARKISPAGRPGQWLYIDTWYTLGPFPNPNRVNIDREFPPDSLIDLDAAYVGKDARTIRWRFVQSEKPEVKPPNAEPYGIWYAYTEFYCDRPRNMLIAMGTDDRGTLKINGIPVWLSSKRLKGWDIDEVWRRVHFNQGVNRILFRVENGWLHTGFSLVLRLTDDG